MYVTAYACMWQRTLHERKLGRVPSASLVYENATVPWLLCGNDVEQDIRDVYLPGPDHLRTMWDLQKNPDRESGQSDNFLDATVRVRLPSA
jgi:hypothetical protein